MDLDQFPVHSVRRGLEVGEVEGREPAHDDVIPHEDADVGWRVERIARVDMSAENRLTFAAA